MVYPAFKFSLISKTPIFDISPHHARMACCYRDKENKYHLFIDYIDSSLNTIHSFQAIVNYYTGTDLINWTFVQTAVDKGNYNYEKNTGDLDCYGIGSPDVLCTDDFIYLFYAGRGNLAPDEYFNSLAHPGEPGYVSDDIMYAKAPADETGAPCGPFVKQGVVLNREYSWESMRIDDPCVLNEDGKIHLYYKGFNDNVAKDNIKLGFASADIHNFKFSKLKNPILSVAGGLEMPRVFKFKGKWNMFLRHFNKGSGTIWKHYVSDDGLGWKLHNECLFDCAGKKPGAGAADMMLVKNFDGSFSGKALACGLEDSILKLWMYNVIELSE